MAYLIHKLYSIYKKRGVDADNEFMPSSVFKRGLRLALAAKQFLVDFWLETLF